jgi:DNA-directed RNA polymerase subunit RPC12/RpoP
MTTKLNAPRGREFEVQLPIGLRDPEGNVHRAVVMRKMTGKEEAILADKRYQRNGGKLVTELLHSCIVRVGTLTPNGRSTMAEMYSADRNFLLLKLRSITFGSELHTGYACTACGEQFHLVEDLDALPVRTLAEDESPDEILVELEDGYVDRDGQVHTALTLRLPTGVDEEAVAAQMRQNASLGKNALLARCMKSLGDMAPHRLEALGAHILSELTLVDCRTIDQALNNAAPGIDLTRELECPHCGKVFKTTLDLSHFLALD